MVAKGIGSSARADIVVLGDSKVHGEVLRVDGNR